MIAPFQLLLPGRVLFGRGEAAKAAGFAAAFGRRALVMHGREPERAAWLLRHLAAAGMVVQEQTCGREPDLPMLEAALAQAKLFAPDCVIGLGGGAVLDLGKALAGLIPSSGDIMEHLEVVGRGLPLRGATLPFIALPTTSGTGSEATRNAVLGVPSQGRKVSLRDDRMIPNVAIVDPGLTDGCPRDVTLASGLDALTQVIEPYVSIRANPATDALARPAIAMGLRALMRLMEREDAAARDEMAWVSFAGGVCLANAGLGAVHGLANVIGGLTGAAHGAICGTLLPFVIDANRRAVAAGSIAAMRLAEVDATLADALGADGSGTAALHRWSRSHGLAGLEALGVTQADHAGVAEAALAASSMKANPVPLAAAALRLILQAAA